MHPSELVGFMRHDEEMEEVGWIDERGPVKVGEFTDPMVNIMSLTMANCLDLSGNIDKELRLV